MIGKRITMEHTDQGKRTDSKKNLSQCHCVRHKPTLTGPGSKPGLRSDGPATNRLSNDMDIHHRCEIPEVSTNFQLSSSLPDILIKM